ncbi:TonB-dependent receptor [Sphingomonadaceae bacterium jetA1]|jgi:TonB-dependent receptor|uniref:TonB-dependent receptor n=1 Tax=Facivitalis istanbulensis TaxID=3075838 RepID=UPI0034831FA2
MPTPPKPAGEEQSQSDIIVTGYRASVERSISIKRKAAGIVDAITAEDMGKMPDLNLSESLQRVPGVTIDRNANGEGRSINLRGLGATFTRVELDGMSGLANGTGGRFGVNQSGRAFNFEILPSELFSKAEIYKTATPDQTEGGLAGLVQLEIPKPLDHKGFKLSAGALGNYGQNTGRVDPRLSLLVSQNWNDTFGIAASIAWSRSHFVTDTAEGGSWRAFSNVNTGTRASDAVRTALIANGPRYYHFNENRNSLGATLSTQYRPSDKLEVSVDGIFAKLKSNSRALRDDMALESGINNPISTTIDSGVITAGQFTGVQQRVGDNHYTTDETMGQIIARVDWHPADGWLIRPSIGYARRKANRTWNLYSYRLADSSGKFDPGIVSYKMRGNFIDFSSTATDFSSDAQNFLFNVFVFRPTADVTDELQGKIDLEKTFDGPLKNVRAGFRYADSSKTRTASQSRLNVSSGIANAAVPNLGSVAGLVGYNVSGSTGPSSILGINESLINGVYFPNSVAVTGTALRDYTGYAAQQTYTIGEKTLSGYASAEFDVSDVQVIGGVRFVSTKQTSSGSTVANINLETQTITPVSYNKTYTAFLPSLTAKWDVVPGAIVRAAYSRTLTRPDYDSLAPSETVSGIDAGGGTGTKGNPNLNPYLSDNIDLGAEYYFGKDGLIAANVFYKKMDGFIDTTTFVETRTYPRQADGVLATGPITFTQPVNSVSASVKGLELAAQSRLWFLPGMFSNLGVQANLTLTDSSANFSMANDVRSRGLPGLSKRSWNATLYYSTPTLDVRFSYAWRSRYLAQFSDDFAIPRFVNAYGQLDFSANYNLNSHISFQLQGLNLTRNQEVDVSSAAYLPYGVNQLDRRILFGARVTF